MMGALAAVVAPGHNNPPSPTPYEMSRDEICSLVLEARNWCDGASIQSQEQADEVSRLLKSLKEARNLADERRAEEAAPFDAGKAEVQSRYLPLIGDTKSVKGTATLAISACEATITPWLRRQDEERRAAADAARKAADEAKQDAAFAFDITRSDDLDRRQKAEALAAQAKQAEAAARKAGKPRATGLRTVCRAEVEDFTAFARWAWTERPDEMRGLLRTLAERLCAARVRGIPGVTIIEERIAS